MIKRFLFSPLTRKGDPSPTMRNLISRLNEVVESRFETDNCLLLRHHESLSSRSLPSNHLNPACFIKFSNRRCSKVVNAID